MRKAIVNLELELTLVVDPDTEIKDVLNELELNTQFDEIVGHKILNYRISKIGG